ncbi:hypothetical protein FRX31_032156, partial [Thalictrum thalictroides]
FYIGKFEILHNLELQTRVKKPLQVMECYWCAPPPGYVKVNTDGASRGNPGQAGWGLIFRNNKCEVLGTGYGGLGIATNFFAESAAIVEALRIAIEKGWSNLWIEADSESAMRSFQTNTVHWLLKEDWESARGKLPNLILSVNRREVNIAADSCSKKGSHLQKGERFWWDAKLPFNLSIENPDSVYYRFVN